MGSNETIQKGEIIRCPDCVEDDHPYCQKHYWKRVLFGTTRRRVAFAIVGVLLIIFLIYHYFFVHHPTPELIYMSISEYFTWLLNLQLSPMAWTMILLFLWLTKW